MSKQTEFDYSLSYYNFEYFMGHCVSNTVRKKSAHVYNIEPVDTESLRDKQLPKLYFHAILANVKIKKYPYKQATPIFKVRQGQNFTLPSRTMQTEDKLMWKIYEKFGFQMTQYELRKQFLQVSVINEFKETVTAIKINLFLITTGPYHQDFALHFNNGCQGRISFDLKISQIIQLCIESQYAQIDLIKKHPGEDFSFSIKTIAGQNGSSSESDLSYPAVILLDKKQTENCTEQEASEKVGHEIGLARKKSQRLIKQIQQGNNLSWTKERGQLPYLTTKVIASEIHNTYFQILIWKYQSSDQEAKRELFADSYVSFYKLFGTESISIIKGVTQYQQRSITMTEKIQHYGKEYGKGVFKFKITNQTYFRQHQICVHTQVGILKTTPIFGVQQTTTSEQCPQLKSILFISAKVEQNIILLNKLQSEQGPSGKIRKVKSQLENDLQEIYHIVQKSSHPPQVLYKYSSQSELVKGQKILVQLGIKMTEYFQIEDPVMNDLCWLILISLIKRSQFSLSHIGFNQKQRKSIKNNKFKNLLQKEEVAMMYKLFLYKLLQLALNSLDHKGSEYQRNFAQIFSAYAYFRIPQFRKEILRLITKETDPEIIEWRGVQFSLHDDIEQRGLRDHANTFSEMFDWQLHFYKCLIKNDQLQNQNISLNDILAQDAWKERFVKRGLAFFYFIKYWVIYIEITLPATKDIQWRYFPGYNRLLRGFFVEMKLRPILEYPDALMEAGLKLLTNQKLVNPFIKILLNKVNFYDSSAVLRVLQYFNLIFQPFAQKHKTLPISFNYIYFFKGIRIILESEFSLAISSALTLIYNHFDIFHIEFRRSISMFFLGKMFFTLFLHWAHNVRQIFNHLITYKIYRQANSNEAYYKLGKFNIKDTDILSRYDELMRLLQLEQQHYHEQKSTHIQTNLDRLLYKKMKIKAYQRFRRNKSQKKDINQPNKYDINLKYFNAFKHQANLLIQSTKILPFKLEKHSSEILTQKNLGQPNKENAPSFSNKQQIKRFSQSNQFTYEAYEETTTQSILFQNIIPEKQYRIQSVPKDKVKYIATYLPQFKIIERQFISSLQKGSKDSPFIKHQISIDNRQIRPQKIDDW